MGFNGRHELYDMANDPGETGNVFGQESAKAIDLKMQDSLETWRSNLEIFPPVALDQDVTTDPEVYKRLSALGYLG